MPSFIWGKRAAATFPRVTRLPSGMRPTVALEGRHRPPRASLHQVSKRLGRPIEDYCLRFPGKKERSDRFPCSCTVRVVQYRLERKSAESTVSDPSEHVHWRRLDAQGPEIPAPSAVGPTGRADSRSKIRAVDRSRRRAAGIPSRWTRTARGEKIVARRQPFSVIAEENPSGYDDLSDQMAIQTS